MILGGQSRQGRRPARPGGCRSERGRPVPSPTGSRGWHFHPGRIGRPGTGRAVAEPHHGFPLTWLHRERLDQHRTVRVRRLRNIPHLRRVLNPWSHRPRSHNRCVPANNPSKRLGGRSCRRTGRFPAPAAGNQDSWRWASSAQARGMLRTARCPRCSPRTDGTPRQCPSCSSCWAPPSSWRCCRTCSPPCCSREAARDHPQAPGPGHLGAVPGRGPPGAQPSPPQPAGLGGPAQIVLTLAAWFGLLLVGWAMVYEPVLGRSIVASSGPTDTSWTTALY